MNRHIVAIVAILLLAATASAFEFDLGNGARINEQGSLLLGNAQISGAAAAHGQPGFYLPSGSRQWFLSPTGTGGASIHNDSTNKLHINSSAHISFALAGCLQIGVAIGSENGAFNPTHMRMQMLQYASAEKPLTTSVGIYCASSYWNGTQAIYSKETMMRGEALGGGKSRMVFYNPAYGPWPGASVGLERMDITEEGIGVEGTIIATGEIDSPTIDFLKSEIAALKASLAQLQRQHAALKAESAKVRAKAEPRQRVTIGSVSLEALENP